MADRSDHLQDDSPSRTQRKREALDLQRLGQRLVELEPGVLAGMPLPEEVLEAIATWKRIRTFEARRRQLQFLGKLMRRVDTAPIEAALARLDGSSADARYAFHQLEVWRDRLIGEPASLTEYLDQHPAADRQRLRHQLARVQKATSEDRRARESRALFRLLREIQDTEQAADG